VKVTRFMCGFYIRRGTEDTISKATKQDTPKEGSLGRRFAPSHTHSFLSTANKRCSLQQRHCRRGDLPARRVAAGSKTQMLNQTTTNGIVHPAGVPGVPAASSPLPGHQNTVKNASQSNIWGVSWLSRLKQYPSHARTCAHTHPYARWLVDQAGQPGHRQGQGSNLVLEPLRTVIGCPIPPKQPAGTPGTLTARWSA